MSHHRHNSLTKSCFNQVTSKYLHSSRSEGRYRFNLVGLVCCQGWPLFTTWPRSGPDVPTWSGWWVGARAVAGKTGNNLLADRLAQTKTL